MLLLPVETLTREFDYKFILGAEHAAKVGGALLGRHDVLLRMAAMVGPGVYLGKNVLLVPSNRPGNPDRYHRLKRHGFSLLHLDEEGAFFAKGVSLERALDLRLDAALLDEDDAILTWGTQQATHYRDHRGTSARVVVTGQPRFDLMKPGHTWWQGEARELASRYGRYVLINTTLTTAVPAEGIKSWLQSGLVRGRGVERAPLSTADRMTFASQLRVLSGLMRVVEELAYSEACDTVVVRPHPSEDLGVYEGLFAGLPNTVVCRGGPAGPWIKGAAVVVHTGCTTALEAALTRKPVVGLGFDEAELGSSMTFEIGSVRTTPEAAVAEIAATLTPGYEAASSVSAHLRHRVANVDSSFNSFVACGSAIDHALARLELRSNAPSSRRLRAWLGIEDLGDGARLTSHAIRRRRRQEYLAYRARFAGLDSRRIHELLGRASALLDLNIRGTMLGRNALLLEAS